MAASSFMGGGNSRTLSHEILSKLFKGNAYISLLPYTASGVTWAALDFGGADMLYTLADTFDIPQDDPTQEEIKIDQKQETIDTTVEAGAWNFNGTVPSNCAEVLEVFYTKAQSSITGVVSQDGTTTYDGKSFFSTAKDVYATILVESEDQKESIAFAKVKLVAKQQRDTDSGLMVIALSGTILANDEATGLQGDFFRGYKHTA